MELSEKIRILRKARGISQEELGLSLASKDNGVSRQSISDWENGKSEPKLDNIRALAVFLNVSFDSLLDESVDLNNPETLHKVLTQRHVEKGKETIHLIFWILFTILLIGIGVTLIVYYNGEATKYLAQSKETGEQTVIGRSLINKAMIMRIPVLIGILVLSLGLPPLLVKLFLEIRNIIVKRKATK